jgi:hypothetical protein
MGISGVYIANQYVAEQTAKTFISFDKGGNWTLIPAPKQDQNGKATNCKLVSKLFKNFLSSATRFNLLYCVVAFYFCFDYCLQRAILNGFCSVHI